MLNIKTDTHHARVPVTVMTIAGDIDSSNFHIFQASTDDLIKQQGVRHLLIDFRDVPHISSAGLRVIHNVFNLLRSLHKDANDDELRKQMSMGLYKSPYIKVLHLNEKIREVFNLAGFETYIEVFDDLESAVNSF